jgi:hypothetical protein
VVVGCSTGTGRASVALAAASPTVPGGTGIFGIIVMARGTVGSGVAAVPAVFNWEGRLLLEDPRMASGFSPCIVGTTGMVGAEGVA